MIHIPISFQKLFLGSLQKHCVRQFVVGGVWFSFRHNRLRSAQDCN